MNRLAERVTLMRNLAESLQRAQAALLTSDLPRIEHETSRQQALCASLLALPAQVLPGPRNLFRTSNEDGDGDTSGKALREEFSLLGERVAQLNRVHAALLRRGQQTLAILSTLFASCDATYRAFLETESLAATAMRK